MSRGDALQNDNAVGTNFYRDHVIAWSKDLALTIDDLETRQDLRTDHGESLSPTGRGPFTTTGGRSCPQLEMPAMAKTIPTKPVDRSAITGRFVPERYAQTHPKTTEHERVPISNPKKPILKNGGSGCAGSRCAGDRPIHGGSRA